MVNLGEVRRAQLVKSTLLASMLVPLGSFKFSSVAKERESGAESNGNVPHLFTPSKTAVLFPEFAVEDLPLSITATLVPAFAVKEHADGMITSKSNALGTF